MVHTGVMFWAILQSCVLTLAIFRLRLTTELICPVKQLASFKHRLIERTLHKHQEVIQWLQLFADEKILLLNNIIWDLYYCQKVYKF